MMSSHQMHIYRYYGESVMCAIRKGAAFHDVTTPNVLVRLYHDGSGMYTMR